MDTQVTRNREFLAALSPVLLSMLEENLTERRYDLKAACSMSGVGTSTIHSLVIRQQLGEARYVQDARGRWRWKVYLNFHEVNRIAVYVGIRGRPRKKLHAAGVSHG